ncbi:uncharacterized serine-rich protein C215.13-like [Chelonus insularis]|uniref:uncharacterized serine-rich protein C215.13-like n=1 Tax=Chelonus insularis TaxID=460826 RepID=UPI00158A3964|nr:uncharacterized serine-rich protein C215.13-like [Chelonus insularis]
MINERKKRPIVNDKIKNLLSDKLINQNGYIHETKHFLFYKSNVIYERSCNCDMEMSCSCCESVVLLFTKSLGQLCGNLMYRPEGLNVNITLDGNTIRSMTVTNYRPLKICAFIPKSLFSIICFNILELNLFPRSITACPRLEIATKNQNWKINYTCVSISTPMGSEVDSLLVNNPNRLTSGVINPLSILENQTISMQSVSPPKQTQSQLSAMTPEAINISKLNISETKMTPEILKTLSTSPMMNVMSSSNFPGSLAISTSTSNIPLTMSADTSSTSSVMMSSRNLPYTATTTLTCKKSSENSKNQTNFRNYPINITTSTTVDSKKFTPYFENTLSISSHNLPNSTTNMLATTKQFSIIFSTPVPFNYSSLITENTQDTTEMEKTTANNGSINSKNISTINNISMSTQKIAETLNKTLTPIISIIPIIFPDNYANLFSDELNFNDTSFSTTSKPFSSGTEVMKDESTETLLDIMLTTTPTIANDSNLNSDDHTTQSVKLNSSIEFLENTTTSHNV